MLRLNPLAVLKMCNPFGRGNLAFLSRVHFTPVRFPDGPYIPITCILDAWTPEGMMTLQLQETITISGNLFSDWHIAPKKTK